MNWINMVGAAILASTLASFTDWYFFGVLFHNRYNATPGAWKKYADKKDEIRSISISTLLQSITSVVFVGACAYLQIVTLIPTLCAAFVVWLMLPLPLLISQSLFLRVHRLIVVSHSLGWLARLLVTALCVSWLL